MSREGEKVEENTVAVIVSLCEKIQDRKNFYNKIISEVVPVRGIGIKPTASSSWIGATENFPDIFSGMIKQQVPFCQTIFMQGFIVIAGRQVFQCEPTQKKTGHQFQQEQYLPKITKLVR